MGQAVSNSPLLTPWIKAAPARVVCDAPQHSMHSYFVTCPESPDGRRIVMFTSTDREGHVGEVRVLDRATGTQQVLAENVQVEDAHRQAYQQWADDGAVVMYQDLRDGQWHVIRADIRTGETRVMATGRQLGFGMGRGHVVPLHGPHWAPGAHRNLELLNVRTGEIRTVLRAEDVRAQWPKWTQEKFGDGEVSIFFPVLSPNNERAFFKMAQVNDGKFRSKTASQRHGLSVYDIASSRLLSHRAQWGHPAWHPDSRHIITPQSVIFDSDTGEEHVIANMPEFHGSHPSFHPSGKLIADCCYLRGPDIPKGWWSVVVADPETAQVRTLHELHELPGGATSWRPPHPHPVFSHDGKRLYFNVSQGDWTQLHVIEVSA